MRFSKAVVRGRVAILILTVLLMIPAVFGMLATRINYDMLNYLPDDMDTVIGQNALLEDFGKGAFSFVVVENMPDKDVAALQKKLESVEHVETVLWYNSLMDTSIPKELLPDKLYDAFNTGDATMMAIFFDTSTSADETFVSGMSALVTDLKDLCEQEEPIYVAIAVVLACVAMMVFLDGWFIPFVFLASIGAAILLNLGSNWFMGEISYITKALSAVLQLAVTMDYSIYQRHADVRRRQLHHDDRGLPGPVLHVVHAGTRPRHRDGEGRPARCAVLRDGPAVAHPAARQAPAEDAPSLYPSEDGWLGQGRDEGVPGVPGAVRGAGSGVLLRL